MIRFRLTTEDNPYNPFTEWDKWNLFDEQHQYWTNALIHRFVNNFEFMSEEEYEKQVAESCMRIKDIDVENKWKIVVSPKKTVVDNVDR